MPLFDKGPTVGMDTHTEWTSQTGLYVMYIGYSYVCFFSLYIAFAPLLNLRQIKVSFT